MSLMVCVYVGHEKGCVRVWERVGVCSIRYLNARGELGLECD